ncbi:MAG TPA: alpha/beta hydrolase [Allosphingosinicella sp.]|jgi:pimeloyl-ACP methyl ester carboxylesterase
MNRRFFLAGALALGVAACTPAAVGAVPAFEPTRFSVEVRGRGPDVILIPGLTSGPSVWARTVAAVPGYRYHLIHVAGFAGAPVRGNARGAVVAPLADEIARYIADRRLDRPAIVGHSMGGTLAMIVAARHPALAGKVMVVDMLPQPAGLFGGTASDFGPLAERLRDMMDSPGGRRLFGSLLTAFSPPDASTRRSDPDVVGRATQELAVMDLAPQLARIRVPLTIVYASPNAEGRRAVDRTFAGAYAGARGARLVRIDDSGHMVMLDQPGRFQAALTQFLAR